MLGKEMLRGPRASVVNPLWNHYRCADGKWISLGMPDADRYWKTLCAALGLGELAEAPKFADYRRRAENAEELIAIMDRKFVERPREEWLAVLKENGNLIVSVLNTISDLLDDPQVVANEYIVDYEHPKFGAMKLLGLPIRFHETPGNARGHAPTLGQHTEEVLRETLGYSAAEVRRLRDTGVI
jgi:crotonobetainyl-CoA:carnitine CoA-transferase CaiB-like acyl-CoA transferase